MNTICRGRQFASRSAARSPHTTKCRLSFSLERRGRSSFSSSTSPVAQEANQPAAVQLLFFTLPRGRAPGEEPGTREATQHALNHFKRLIRPAKMRSITSKTIADYVAVRRQERKRKGNDESPLVSPATVNKELRTLRAVLRKAVRWGFLATMPEIEFLREPGKLAVYVTPEHFAKLYRECGSARWPEQQPYSPADWWRGLLVTAYMTGWRIGSLLALRWEDVDLKAGTALSRHGDNKGKRDQKIPLHPVVVEHLAKLASFGAFVFPWNHARRSLFDEFNKIQAAAAVKPEGPKAHYGFHDFRRAFATMNAANLTPDALQHIMQHRDYQTTQRYINLARQLNPAVQNLFVPQLAVAEVG